MSPGPSRTPRQCNSKQHFPLQCHSYALQNLCHPHLDLTGKALAFHDYPSTCRGNPAYQWHPHTTTQPRFHKPHMCVSETHFTFHICHTTANPPHSHKLPIGDPPTSAFVCSSLAGLSLTSHHRGDDESCHCSPSVHI